MRLLGRARNRQKLLSAGIVLAVLCVSSWVSAQPIAAPRVQFEATGACPSQAEFLARVRARMDADGTRAPADISVRVTLSAQAGGAHGTVEIRRGATNTRRIVEGGRCEEVAEALALIAALAARDADPRSLPRARKPDKNSPPSGQRTAPSSSSNSSARSGSKRAVASANAPEQDASESGRSTSSAGADPSRSTAQGAGDTGSSSSTHSDAAERNLQGESSARRDPDGAFAVPEQVANRSTAQGGASEQNDAGPASEDREAAADGGRAASWRVGATAMLFSGLAPALQPGLQLQAAVMLNAGALAWSLQLGARIARSDSLASPDGDARFGFAGGVVRLCAAHALGSTPLTLTGCAAAEPGVFSAQGENTRNVRSHSRLWLAAGAAADLSVQLASWLSLRAGAELLAPFRRDRIWLAGDTLYRVPALGFRWHLGLEVPFG